MYENLTCLIDALETDTYGEMVVDTKSKGTLDDPIHLPYIKYTDAVSELWKAIYGFSDMHPEFELTNYQDILAKHGLAWAASDLKDADTIQTKGNSVYSAIATSSITIRILASLLRPLSFLSVFIFGLLILRRYVSTG